MYSNPKSWHNMLWVPALAVAAATCQAQDFRATLTGEITDPTGALIPGAQVTATNVATGTTYKGTASGKGVYYINYVLPGVYTVVAEATGFETAKQDKITLETSQTFNQNFKLVIGRSSETLEITAAPPALETSTGSGNNIINARELENVPVNGGQIYALIGTVPGTQSTNSTGSQQNGYTLNNNYTIGGGIVGNNQFTLNGSNITSQFTYDNQSAGAFTIAPSLDSVEELNVQTTTYDARFGRTSGGTVSTVTKGGTNQFHGSARYAYEGTVLNANSYQNNYQNAPRNGQVQNQFWITAGGPIIKNKLFGFFGFEGFHQSLQQSITENVAPAFLRPGYNGNAGVNFGLIGTLDPSEFPNGLPVYQPGSGVCTGSPGTPITACNSNNIAQNIFPNDTIPASQLNPTALAVLKYLPLPNIASAANSVRGNNYFAQTPREALHKFCDSCLID